MPRSALLPFRVAHLRGHRGEALGPQERHSHPKAQAMASIYQQHSFLIKVQTLFSHLPSHTQQAAAHRKQRLCAWVNQKIV